MDEGQAKLNNANKVLAEAKREHSVSKFRIAAQLYFEVGYIIKSEQCYAAADELEQEAVRK